MPEKNLFQVPVGQRCTYYARWPQADDCNRIRVWKECSTMSFSLTVKKDVSKALSTEQPIWCWCLLRICQNWHLASMLQLCFKWKSYKGPSEKNSEWNRTRLEKLNNTTPFKLRRECMSSVRLIFVALCRVEMCASWLRQIFMHNLQCLHFRPSFENLPLDNLAPRYAAIGCEFTWMPGEKNRVDGCHVRWSRLLVLTLIILISYLCFYIPVFFYFCDFTLRLHGERK